jgi:MFS family permease
VLAKMIMERFEFMRGNMLVLTVRQILGMFIRKMIFAYSSLYIIAVGGESAEIGIINSLMPLAGLLMFPISGYLTDRTGRVKLIALAGYLQALTTLLYVFAPSWEWIAFGALIQGFMVFQFPPTSAILADSLNPKNRGVGIATMNTLANGCSTFSPYIAGLIIEMYGPNFGMRLLYAGMVMINVINATLVIKFLKETTSNETTTKIPGVVTILRDAYSGIPELLRTIPRSVNALGLMVGLGFISNAIISPFWVVYAIDMVGLSSIDWGLILLLETIFKTLLTIPAGMIADRYSRSKVILMALLLSLASVPTFALARGFTDVLLIRMGVALAGALFMPASTALMADYVPRTLRGRVMAAMGRGSVMIGASGGGTGGPGMGYLFTIPVMISSIAGGILYAVNPIYPWVCVLVATVLQIVTVILFIRDPQTAEA